MTGRIVLAVFLLALALGATITGFVYRSEHMAATAQFEAIADETADRVRNRVSQHIALLVSAGAHSDAIGTELTRTAFARFIAGLDLDGQFQGIQGIGFARIVPNGEEGAVAASVARDYGVERAIWPQTDQSLRTAIVLLEPFDERNRAALAYDMFSEPRRREAMLRALEAETPQATEPVTLVQEISNDKQTGFLVYLPVKNAQGAPAGFIYAPFRAGDLHRAALGGRTLPVEIRTTDKDAPAAPALYASPGFRAEEEAVTQNVLREIQVAGRTWLLEVQPDAAILGLYDTPFTLITAAISLMLAFAMASATRWQLQAVERAKALGAMAEETLKEKDLMLQEMKHRIKNSIARILAMARQTAAGSDSLEAFSQSFTARLQSMANAQDLLTRSHWQQTSLEELLDSELQQVFGPGRDRITVSGPPTMLSGKQAQALGLTFHELATNALKYGAGSNPDGRMAIEWRVETKLRKKNLRLVWRETTPCGAEPPDRRGFGTRLIDASIRGELGGAIERDFSANGLAITIDFPLNDLTAA